MRGNSRAHVLASSCAMLALFAALSSCSDSSGIPTHPNGGDAQKLRDSVVLSGPLGSAAGVSTSGPGAPSSSALTYASMPPGTLADGDSVRIANASIARAVVVAQMGDGGFDPVPIEASENDSLDVSVFRHSEEGEHVFMRVPHFRPPAVIRTTPGQGRTDVPLNQQIVIVISQPLDATTVTSSSVLLTLNGVPVPATVQLQLGQPWVILLSPKALLAPNATYSIVVTTSVTDVNGSAIPAQVASEFVTSTSVAEVAAIAVRASAVHHGQQGTAALASVGGTIVFAASNVSAAGDTLLPDSGQDMRWSSSDTRVAAVIADGLFYRNIGNVTALSAGVASISACLGAICGVGHVTVREVVADVAPVLMADLGGIGSRVWAMSGPWVSGSAFSSAGGCEHAFLWSASTGAEDLGTLPGECHSSGRWISSGPTVMGYGDQQADGYVTYWIWTRAAGMRQLSMRGVGPERWFPDALDSIGDIEFDSDSNRTAIRDPGGNAHILTLPIGWQSAGGMNNANQITFGTLAPPSCYNHGFCAQQCGTVGYLWDFSTHSTVATLEPRDPHTNAPVAICPWALNDAGMVGGSVFVIPQSGDAAAPENAFRWSAQRGFEFAPAFDSGVTAEGVDINEAGDETLYLFSYVHFGQDSVFDLSSAVWMADGRIIRLGSLGGDWTAANGINNSHIVVGHSQLGSSTGQQHAVFWDLSIASQSRVAPPSPIAPSARRVDAGARVMPPEHAWQRNTIRHWSRVRRP